MNVTYKSTMQFKQQYERIRLFITCTRQVNAGQPILFMGVLFLLQSNKIPEHHPSNL